LTLIWNSPSNAASSVSAVGARAAKPAQLTRTSISPAASATRPTSDISEKSAAMNCASCPPARIFSTVLAPRVSSRPVMITDAPFSAIASAVAEPIPDVPPVIRAVLP